MVFPINTNFPKNDPELSTIFFRFANVHVNVNKLNTNTLTWHMIRLQNIKFYLASYANIANISNLDEANIWMKVIK
jgi:hypothetical protein